ncbi:MAG: hypothetical protein AAFQ59_14190 [Pseudomonadota bacterium]
MTRHNVYFSTGRLMGMFLQHRLWAWTCALKRPLLAILPVSSYLVGWWMLGPILVALPVALIAGMIDHSYALPVLVFATLGIMLVMFPVISQILRNLYIGYRACLALLIGKRHAAEQMRDSAATDLAQSTHSHD